jgi:NAD-dependent SIR2 family protein deacetylase
MEARQLAETPDVASLDVGPLDVDPAGQFDEVVRRVAAGNVLVLSGAGLSTESGIPDYRGPTGRARPGTPMTIQQFRATERARQRYWARSFLGWGLIGNAEPNSGHRVVAALERAGLVTDVITQNVDELHQRAGSQRVVDLHGVLSRVVCLDCGQLSPRDELGDRLHEANRDWRRRHFDSTVGAAKPDGDYDLDDAAVEEFVALGCVGCGGPLKPDVVFFGENVHPERVAYCYERVEASDFVLVLGSSLTVASGFRFVRRAIKVSVPVAIINQGVTRGDPYAQYKIDAPLGDTLGELARRLGFA